MTVIHANDSTTQFLSLLYEQRRDISMHITEASTNSAAQRAIREGDTVLMLGHGNKYGLFSMLDHLRASGGDRQWHHCNQGGD